MITVYSIWAITGPHKTLKCFKKFLLNEIFRWHRMITSNWSYWHSGWMSVFNPRLWNTMGKKKPNSEDRSAAGMCQLGWVLEETLGNVSFGERKNIGEVGGTWPMWELCFGRGKHGFFPHWGLPWLSSRCLLGYASADVSSHSKGMTLLKLADCRDILAMLLRNEKCLQRAPLHDEPFGGCVSIS